MRYGYLSFPPFLESFSTDDADGSENVTSTLSRLFQFAENVKCRRISLELISWGPNSSLNRERKIRRPLFTYVHPKM